MEGSEGYACSVSSDKKVKLEVGLVRDEEKRAEGFLHVQVSATEEAKRAPVNVLCLVDCSASMTDGVYIQDAQGNREETGLNLLDLARHAVATIGHGLNEKDMVGVVGWSDSIVCEMPLTQMNEAGHKEVDKILNEMFARSTTGMIEVIEHAFEQVNKLSKPTVVFLLTDGLPDKKPSEGFSSFVKNLMEKSKVPVQLNTFGFGYSVDSNLLTEIAEAGRGTFSFIPDGGFLGTVIVNSIANLVSVALTDTQVSVDVCDGITIEADALRYPKGSMDMPVVSSDGTVSFNIGAVNYQQPRSIALPVKIAPDFVAVSPVATVSVNCTVAGERVNAFVEDAVTQVLPAMRLSYSHALVARAKTIFADTLYEIIHTVPRKTKDLSEPQAKMKKCADELKALRALASGDAEKCIDDILRDCEGQATQAVSNDEWFGRWGLHYLCSLCSAHEFEVCNNFKDPGVQHYGGSLFASVRDDLDDIFQHLPPPEHHRFGALSRRSAVSVTSSRVTSSSSSSRRVDPPAPRVSMSRFMDMYSGCFAGSCYVTMADGSTKLVSEVRKGDLIRTGCECEPTATVLVSVQTTVGGDVCVLSPSKLIITPWHPVDLEGKNNWSFPNNCACSKEHTSEPLFTFVLDKAHSVLVNGVRCVTLAHGVTSGSDVRAHPYYGTNNCINDLQKHFPADYAAGQVKLPVNCVYTRDPNTKLVNGISF